MGDHVAALMARGHTESCAERILHQDGKCECDTYPFVRPEDLEVVTLHAYREVVTERVRLEQELERLRRDHALLVETVSPDAVERLKNVIGRAYSRLREAQAGSFSLAVGGALRILEEEIKGGG